MGLPFIDLKAQYGRIREAVRRGIDAVLENGQYVMGPEVEELERRLAEFAGTRHAIGCASGTDALVMALMALGIGPGDAVLVPPFTFMATAESVALVGATPAFADIDPRSFNLNPAALEAALAGLKKSRPKLRPRAIIAVDLFGLCADYGAIGKVAERHGLCVIEDAAQSFGATHKGRPACSFGSIACTSFFPAKPLGCYGDGGMCFTDDDELDEILRSIRVHGQGSHKYENLRIGINGRLDTLQAAVLLAKLAVFPEEVRLRQEAAARYDALLCRVPGLVLPAIPEGDVSVFAQYSVLARDAALMEAMLARLAQAAIPTARYYPIPLHLQPAFAHLGHKPGDFPVSEDAACRIFSLPMHPYLTAEVQERIARALEG